MSSYRFFTFDEYMLEQDRFDDTTTRALRRTWDRYAHRMKASESTSSNVKLIPGIRNPLMTITLVNRWWKTAARTCIKERLVQTREKVAKIQARIDQIENFIRAVDEAHAVADANAGSSSDPDAWSSEPNTDSDSD